MRLPFRHTGNCFLTITYKYYEIVNLRLCQWLWWIDGVHAKAVTSKTESELVN